MRELLDKCQTAYDKIQQWRDIPSAFDLETDRMYLHDVVQEVQDEARKLGCQTESIDDPNIDQALNAVAEIIGWCEDQNKPTPSTLKEWYSPTELAELMKRSPFTVREKWCNRGRIECEKDTDSNKWRIPGHEVSRLLNGGALKQAH